MPRAWWQWLPGQWRARTPSNPCPLAGPCGPTPGKYLASISLVAVLVQLSSSRCVPAMKLLRRLTVQASGHEGAGGRAGCCLNTGWTLAGALAA
ncbi:hypothetical protein RRF57_002613 [Xylaria bambusicola]|uniref:Uncharacterized protein n=1 Tax=Xylaria bambusicola TaxID=326684 RepID=A0AAN7UEW9_9PEZI